MTTPRHNSLLKDLTIASLPAVAALMPLLASSHIVHAAEMIVKIDNFTFNPPEITVKPGTTVTWENADDIPHSVVENDNKFRSKALDTGDKYSMSFASAGEVVYFCGLHPHMKGKIVVAP